MSRTRGAGAGSRAIKCVAYERNWCRIACRQACRVRKEPVPDRVRYGPSPDLVSSHPDPPRRPHVSAMLTVRRTARPSSAMPRPNMALSPTPPTAVYEHIFFCLAVALYGGTFGGAAKANRWAALTSWRMPNRRARHTSATHGAEQSEHNRTSPSSQTYVDKR